MRLSCTLLILTYKGKHHLEHLLPTVKTAVENSPDYQIHVMIIDNGCDEGTKAYVNTNYPGYTYEFSPKNDYLFSLNPFVKKLNSEFVFILNDDMKLHPNVLNELLPVIDNDPELFAVSCNIRDWDDRYTAAFPSKLIQKRGWLSKEWIKDYDPDRLHFSLYGGGGAAVFRTRIFKELNGFDPLFRPAYAEDLDLGHRAWHMGYKSVYHPKAVLYHREGGTIKDQFKADRLTQKIYKNEILWMVKNGNYPGFLLWFLLLLPYRMIFGFRTGKNTYLALIKSLPKLPLAIFKRASKPKAIIKDRQLTEILSRKYEYTIQD
jgi:GT2 family glycosyltransferase